MTTSHEFLTKIRYLITAEEQRAVRSVYADWLDEQNKPLDASRQRVLAFPSSDDRREEFAAQLEIDGQTKWAEFIRLQVKTSKGFQCRNPRYDTIYDQFHGQLPVDRVFREKCGVCGACYDDQRDRMIANAILLGQVINIEGQIEIYRENWVEWCYPAPRGACLNNTIIHDAVRMGVRFARGLISGVQCSWGTQTGWQLNGDAITDFHPVERVALTTTPDVTVTFSPENKAMCCYFEGCRRSHLISILTWNTTRDRDYLVNETRKILLKKEWPGIEFVLSEA